MKFILSLTVLLCASVGLFAQQPTPTTSKPIVQRRCCGQRFPKRVVTATPTPQPTQAAPDFFVGDAKVDVTKDETVVRLAMAQHGSVLIELPSNDGPRYIIPGDPEMATVDQKALERNKRAIVVRPGAQFVPPARNHPTRSPAATVTAQMRSGLVVTFLFYPVEDLSQNVHRCVLNYNRDEVVARRRRAGLPVNLDDNQERGESTAQTAAALSSSSSQTVKEEEPQNIPTEPTSGPALLETKTKPKSKSTPSPSPTAAGVDAPRPGAAKNNTESTNFSPATVASCATALEEATGKPKQFKKWTKPVHGISLSFVQRSEQSQNFNVLIVAVKSNSKETLRLVAGGPDLFIETLDDKGQTLNRQQLKKAYARGTNGRAP